MPARADEPHPTMADAITRGLLEEALEALPEAVAIFDAEGRFVFWNGKFQDVYGAGADLRAGLSFAEHLRSCAARGFVPAALGREEAWVEERLARFAAADGAHEHRLADGLCLRVQDRALAGGGRIGIRTDVTGLADRERAARVLLEANPSPVIVSDVSTREVLWVNEAAVRFYGHPREAFLRLRVDDFRIESAPGELDALAPQLDAPGLFAEPRLHRTASGEVKVVTVTMSRLDFEGRAAMAAAIFDVTEQHRMQEEVRRAREFLRQVVDHVPTAVFAKDMADGGRFVIFNRASEALFGHPSGEALGRSTGEVFGAADAARFRLQDEVALRLGAVETVEDETVTRPDGSLRHVRTRKVALADGLGERPRFLIGVCEDVTERRAGEARIAHMAHHDGLTDLPNRFLFGDRLASALARARDARELLAVLCIDLDGFKAVNDAHGHAAGDRLLQAVSDRLRGALRSCDTAARLGGDEFAVLQAPIAEEGEAALLAGRLIAALSAPYALDRVNLRVSASIGISLARPPDIGPSALMERADGALYRAKREGRNTFRFADLAAGDGGPAALRDIVDRMRRDGGGTSAAEGGPDVRAQPAAGRRDGSPRATIRSR